LPDSLKPFADGLIGLGFGESVTPEIQTFWDKHIKETYKGDAGRRKMLGYGIPCFTLLSGDTDT
jgi:hypothetical protein